MSRLSNRLHAWALNEEMIDTHFTAHGCDCVSASELLVQQDAEIARLERELVLARETAKAFRDEARRAIDLLLEERQVGVADTCVYLNDR